VNGTSTMTGGPDLERAFPAFVRVDTHYPLPNRPSVFENRDGSLHRVASEGKSQSVLATRVASRLRLFGSLGQEIIWSKERFVLWVDGRMRVFGNGYDALSVGGRMVSGSIEIKVVASSVGIIPTERLEIGATDSALSIEIARRVPYLCEYRDIWEGDWGVALRNDLQRALPGTQVLLRSESERSW
jgi:hypothetical protein